MFQVIRLSALTEQAGAIIEGAPGEPASLSGSDLARRILGEAVTNDRLPDAERRGFATHVAGVLDRWIRDPKSNHLVLYVDAEASAITASRPLVAAAFEEAGIRWPVEQANFMLCEAVVANDAQGVAVALARGARPALVDREDARAWAVFSSHMRGRSLVVEAVNYSCARRGRMDCTTVLSMLLAEGVDPNAADDAGYTALHQAASVNHVAAIRVLHQAGANLNAASVRQYTPLYTAIHGASQEAFDLLIDLGADPHARNWDGKTPAEYALVDGKPDFLARLHAKKAHEALLREPDAGVAPLAFTRP